MKETLLGLIGGYAAVVALMFVFQRNLQYFPDKSRPDPAVAQAFGMTVVEYRTADGIRLQAWYRDAAPDKPTILYFHGNGGNIMGRAPKVRALLDRGYGVLRAEYRGYGGNHGDPSEAGFYQDGRAALGHLESKGIAPHNIVLWGESLGTGVAVQLAQEQALQAAPLAAVVLEAPFTSAVDVGAAHYFFIPVRLLVKDRYESFEKIAEIGAPLLVVHGDQDNVVPIRFGRALFAAAKEPKKALWVAGGDHGNLAAFGLSDAVIGFLESAPNTAAEQR
jgi:fermentation-respiration switch protein FrsA (DUF1100 family)